MRIKMLRSLGKNMPEPTPEEGEAVRTSLDKDPPFIEGQVREMADGGAHYLIRNGLAEETTDEITDLPAHAKAKTPAKAPAAKFAVGSHVEVIDKTHPEFKQKGEVISVAAVSGTGDPNMYNVRRDDGREFRASDSQLKKA